MKKKEIPKKNSISNNDTYLLTFKKGKPIEQIIPNNFLTPRQMNSIFNYKDFIINKERDYTPPYEPFDIFPTWPKEEEIEVKN